MYKENNTDNKYFVRHLNPNPINVDILAQCGFGHIGFYAKYSLFDVFQKKYSPSMNSFSTGVMLLF